MGSCKGIPRIDFGAKNKNKDNNNNHKNTKQLRFTSLRYTMKFPFMSLLAILAEEEEKERHKSWKQRELSLEGRRRRDRRYPRVSLKYYPASPFKYLYDSGNDQALLNATGVDHAEFTRILEKFQPIFDNHKFDMETGRIGTRKKTSDGTGYRGRPRTIDAIGALGLVLVWYRTTGAVNRTLPLIFGLTESPMERWLRFGKRCLFVALQEYKPTLPSAEEIAAYKHAIGSKYTHKGKVGASLILGEGKANCWQNSQFHWH